MGVCDIAWFMPYLFNLRIIMLRVFQRLHICVCVYIYTIYMYIYRNIDGIYNELLKVYIIQIIVLLI